MEANRQADEGDIPPATFVNADEVDQAGADISTGIPPTADYSDRLNISLLNNNNNSNNERWKRLKEFSDTVRGSVPLQRSNGSARPPLRRDGSAPPPPQQPPPPTPGSQQDPDGSTDSLSLMQLRKIVTDMPRIEPTAYAFEYADTQPFPDEIEEWFQYTEQDRFLILNAKTAFDYEWGNFVKDLPPRSNDNTWISVDDELRKTFVLGLLEKTKNADVSDRGRCLAAVTYILMGAWGLTAVNGEESQYSSEGQAEELPNRSPQDCTSQLDWMNIGVSIITSCSGVQVLFDALSRFTGQHQDSNTSGPSISEHSKSDGSKYPWFQETDYILTSLYILLEVGRRRLQDHNDSSLRDTFSSLNPGIPVFLTEAIARFRWGEYNEFNLTRIILLLWKSVLLLFGDSKELKQTKAVLKAARDPPDDSGSHPFLTASPLDYHLFRQEIISKYPSYNPPPLLVPLEPENNSILPPLPNHPSRNVPSNGLFLAGAPNGSTSILDQPVHIATPAPSPPPSPAGPGGKAGKKQNYQTNNNFPFLYPPLDSSSNKMGGKGTTGIQDMLVEQRWEGGDVPTSIMEAGTLFASRVRMTRAMRQLWGEREMFLKHERGWGKPGSFEPSEDEAKETSEEVKKQPETDDIDAQRRLDVVEDYYSQAMPELQSMIVVLLKVILSNVSAIVAQGSQNALNGLPGLMTSLPIPDFETILSSPKPKANFNVSAQLNGNGSEGKNGVEHESQGASTLIELNAVRVREITTKGISGVVLLLLKWFKISHILKYEYLTQLLLDSNYLPLVLKLLAHQDVDKSIDQRIDQEHLSFFNVCRQLASEDSDKVGEGEASKESGDEAAPPPIARHRKQLPAIPDMGAETSHPILDAPPEVDELGNPTTLLPPEPITTFSWRNFFTSINYLRIMQKITVGKAHRCLLLVQYKSSTILRKALKIPQPDLRLYTLKLFKSQVPYCGRKWRQSNMRVITAIYLHCRPDLRDDWLAGSDVDAEVEESLPLEQALRALTHWWHLRMYPEQMGKEKCVLDEERDFFAKELEGMGWGNLSQEEVGFGEEAATRGDGGLLQTDYLWQ
ncbi:MAG: Factor arrest protein 11 [Cirrosporium novae-zelandiae]|nr:MAG: Factor arrest protein 11 [Cirrosporium novae-zelandiae]